MAVFADALNLRALWALKSLLVAAQIIAVGVASVGLDVALPMLPIVSVMAVYVLLTLLTGFRSRTAGGVSVGEFFLHLVADVGVLTALLYFTGGSTNPFVSLLLLPLVIVAATLPHRHVWAMAGLVLACYSLLMFYYRPLPHARVQHGSSFDLHVLGMWFSFVMGVALIVFFVARLAESLRQRDRKLAEAREQALEDRHLVALGTLAAGAAHELGTPLATMAVVSGELLHDHGNDPELREKAEILQQQLVRCKTIVSDMAASAGVPRAEAVRRIALDKYLCQVLSQWRLLRPGAAPRCHLAGEGAPPVVVTDKTLTQALMNVLNNAADASPDQIEVCARWDGAGITVAVCDRGPGIPAAAQAHLGTPFFTTKAGGQGLGLYLARAAIGRHGGALALLARPGGGTCVEITLPDERPAVP
ncbi:MAG TPA: HAMP domain-containing histidine kinase [Gammaproteobacteria bacterium]|nr:HAMP domain-containing histidine kinase [Gammaproteobacteria bacterium]